MTKRTIVLMALAEVPVDRGRQCKVEGLDLALFRIGDAAYAIADSCPHQGASLANGKLQGALVSCPAHGLKFDVRTGCSSVSAELRTGNYPVRVIDGQIVLDIEEPQPQGVKEC
ncbi:MAG: (2Fe-2S)-binding protein [Rhodoferax sp.]|nr:MAG: (2Fe-2S)-binding protein [Rhodoferax sp.]